MAGIDAATVLMLHCDGIDAATSFPDASASSHTVTANGNAQVDTAQSKFGTASCLLDGTGDFLTIPDSADWDITGDFTVDCWIRPASVAGTQVIVVQQEAAALLWGVSITSTTLNLNIITSEGIIALSFATTFIVDTQAHIAVVKHGNRYFGFKDGALLDTFTDNTTVGNLTGELSIGALTIPESTFFNGHIDEFRMSKTARWIADFTVQATAYSALSGSGNGQNRFSSDVVVVTAPFDGDISNDICTIQSIHWDAGDVGAGESLNLVNRDGTGIYSASTTASETVFTRTFNNKQKTKGLSVSSLTDGTLFIYKQ